MGGDSRINGVASADKEAHMPVTGIRWCTVGLANKHTRRSDMHPSPRSRDTEGY